MTDAPERIWAFYTPDDFDDSATITDYETVHHGGQQYIRADLAKPKVKPLVWDGHSDIGCLSPLYYGCIYPNSGGNWTLDNGECVSAHKTPSDAKAAAQADYESRILAALDMGA